MSDRDASFPMVKDVVVLVVYSDILNMRKNALRIAAFILRASECSTTNPLFMHKIMLSSCARDIGVRFVVFPEYCRLMDLKNRKYFMVGVSVTVSNAGSRLPLCLAHCRTAPTYFSIEEYDFVPVCIIYAAKNMRCVSVRGGTDGCVPL